MKKNKKKNIFLACVAVLVIVGVAILLLWDREDSYSSDFKESDRTDTIVYNGKEYKYDEHLSNYLFVGVDTRDAVDTYETQQDAGQADSIFLLSYNRKEHTLKCIAIPRDTITSIQILSVDGKDMGTTQDHLSLQYAFGDGKSKSCELMKNAVSGMLYGVPIQGYCSLNMDGIGTAVASMGELTLTVPDDTWVEMDETYTKGSKVLITSENAESFVRHRNTSEGNSALARMNRQKVFMEAFATKAKDLVANDNNFIVEMFDDLTPYMVTNMSTGELAQLLEAQFDSDADIVDLPGEGVTGGRFDEYHIDDEKLYQMILDMFYNEI